NVKLPVCQGFRQRLARGALQVGQRSAERSGKALDGRVSMRRIFGGRRLQHFIQRGRQITPPCLEGRQRFLQLLVEKLVWGGGIWIRFVSNQRFVDDQSQAVNVAAGRHWLALDLFRRSVRR